MLGVAFRDVFTTPLLAPRTPAQGPSQAPQVGRRSRMVPYRLMHRSKSTQVLFWVFGKGNILSWLTMKDLCTAAADKDNDVRNDGPGRVRGRWETCRASAHAPRPSFSAAPGSPPRGRSR
jgi:hypothetical protein